MMTVKYKVISCTDFNPCSATPHIDCKNTQYKYTQSLYVQPKGKRSAQHKAGYTHQFTNSIPIEQPYKSQYFSIWNRNLSQNNTHREFYDPIPPE